MVFMLMIVGSFKVFDVIYLLTEGGPGVSTAVLSYYVYYQAFQRNDIGYASALSVVLFVLVLGLTAFVWQLRKRVVSYA
jgi:multiple sugar transport system permease protein